MADDLDTGALLGRTYELPNRQRVRLRLARRSDVPGLRALLAQRDAPRPEPAPLELERLVRYDPRRRLVLCATAPIGGREAVVGVGAIDLRGPGAEPDTIVVDERLTEGLARLLESALVSRAARRVA